MDVEKMVISLFLETAAEDKYDYPTGAMNEILGAHTEAFEFNRSELNTKLHTIITYWRFLFQVVPK